MKECSVRRRYSDFEWLRKELERDSKVRINFIDLDPKDHSFYRLLFHHCHPKLGNVKCLHFFVVMMEYLKMNLSTNDVKVSNNLLTSKLNSTLAKQHFLHIISRVAGHPLAQNERSLHVFLQESVIDYDKYVPGKVRNS